MSDEKKAQAAEYSETGKLPLGDDDLDAVAGGAFTGEPSTMASNRPYKVPAGSGLCKCSVEDKWASRKSPYKINGISYVRYDDITCNRCNKVWPYWTQKTTLY